MECNAKARLQALRRYKILDTDPEEAFDDLMILASHLRNPGSIDHAD